MIEILLVSCFGALGVAIRYGVNLVAARSTVSAMPVNIISTLLVNLIGCLLIGYVFKLHQEDLISPMWRAALVTGFLGGLTTFSSFVVEVLQLLQNNDLIAAASYSCISIFGGLMACYLGMKLGM